MAEPIEHLELLWRRQRFEDRPAFRHQDALIPISEEQESGRAYAASVVHRVVRETVEGVLAASPENQEIRESPGGNAH